VRSLVLVLALAGALAAAACGGSEDEAAPAPQSEPAAEVDTVSTTSEVTLPGWAAPHLAGDGPEVAAVFSTSDYAVGENRIGFLVIRNDGSLVQSPTAEVYVGRDGDADAIHVTAALEPLAAHPHAEGTAPHDHEEATDLYVARVDLPEEGRYWLVAQPDGAAIQAVGALDVREQTVSPPVGSEAIPSDTPTLADAPAEEITTATPPDTELLRVSVADALAAREPFVLVFATPKFCQSRACGPTVEVVDTVRQGLAGSGVQFIHVEIYEGNDPAMGVNQWVEEWGLPTEPWVFLVDSDGVIREKFEGSVSVDELDRAVRETLL
jgi:hypothetical protein